MKPSMDRCAVFVDAGYLYAEGGKLFGAGPKRRYVQVNALKANEFLVDRARRACELPTLRTYWYDGAKDRVPTAEHQAIADLPNVKLRLGRVNQQNLQKGVDALIYHDLVTLARERAISDAFLLSGDEDLREGVRAAQELGVRVALIGILTPSGSRNQSRELAREADEVLMLTKEKLSGFISERMVPDGTAPGNDDPRAAAKAVATRYAEAWLSAATDDETSTLRDSRPRIPTPLDGDLMRTVEEELGESLRPQESLRRLVRTAFWERVSRQSGDPKPGPR
ncbi:MAG: NYN domain-containing protein [Acidimicrobiaceae bacterium]|nr:NYN domain-containing protein [Acidimicrobiaceae bacterium]